MVRPESRDELEERLCDQLKYSFRQELINSIVVVKDVDYPIKRPEGGELYQS